MLCIDYDMYAYWMHILYPHKSKSPDEAGQAYFDNVYAKASGSTNILSGNGMEFEKELFTNLTTQL